MKTMTTKPKLGQNFLIDPSASLAIVEALGDISAATVLEIGPGKGAITKLLATRAHRLIAVELDPTLVEPLHQALPPGGNPPTDILTTDISSLVETKDSPSSATCPTTSPRKFCSISSSITRRSTAPSSWCSAKSPTASPPNPALATTACSPRPPSSMPEWTIYSLCLPAPSHRRPTSTPPCSG